MKKIILSILIVSLSVILVSCNNDDSEHHNDNNSSDTNTSKNKDNETPNKIDKKLTHLIVGIIQKVAINKIKNKMIIKNKKKIMMVIRINNLPIKIKVT
ncbi:hypothetical protein [Staphylococcus epidermidis]|uniref:hypothetical protein n=1 Tax=Staphylococcus epidermidis TaxID=1282 RepID=UPI0020CFB8D1|nr:hypothetical protein [Staphylococcus epidermidis]